ncbi:MAG TPA: Gfo/Idh/MocA family oxidoreductase [Usitatibacter sp.]
MRPFGWAVVGPGNIARRFAQAVQGLEGAALVAVQGRDPGRCAAFARKWGRDGASMDVASDIASLACNERVDAIYVATPHAFHAAAIRECIAAGKPVLCEKPLVAHHCEGLAVVALARRHRVFLMEAVWTRFLPICDVVRAWLRGGRIGRVRAIQSSFCFNSPFDPSSRNYDPAQAGGSLLDLGVYNLTMTRWTLEAALGRCPPLQALQASGVVGPSGVDHRASATLEFPGGIVSQLTCGFEMSADNTFRIAGELGSIVIPQFWQATDAELRVAGKDAVAAHRPHRINGFEGEIEEAMAMIRRGDIESPRISHDETLATLEWMDRIREQIGVRYPFETDSGVRAQRGE